MKDNIMSGRKVFAILAVVYHFPTTLEPLSIDAFQVKPAPIHIRFQQNTAMDGMSPHTIIRDVMILKAAPPSFNDENDSGTTSDELRRSNRRRIRTLQRDDGVDDDNADDDYYKRASMRDDSKNENDEYLRNSRFGYDRSTGTTEKEQVTESDEWDEFDEDDENEEDDDWDIDETKQYDLLENIIIPNPLLDSMDPDGTIERLPELLSDPRFWFDMVLFILFLDFLSFAGPQSDPFIDFPWIY